MGSAGFGSGGVSRSVDSALTECDHTRGELRDELFAQTNVCFKYRQIPVVHADDLRFMRDRALEFILGMNLK